MPRRAAQAMLRSETRNFAHDWPATQAESLASSLLKSADAVSRSAHPSCMQYSGAAPGFPKRIFAENLESFPQKLQPFAVEEML
jgi:hypothetical protein